VPPADQARWTSERERSRHFQKHGPLLGQRTEDEYEASARATIRVGQRFTYEDSGTGRPRVGYYHVRTERFTALNERETRLLTHFRCPERYVRLLPSSGYRRR
jgi:hypothetical protein